MNCKQLAALVLVLALAPLRLAGQVPAGASEAQSYTVFLRQRPIGQETVSLGRTASGWTVRGSNRLGPPLDIVLQRAEIEYDAEWRPTRLHLDGTSRGQVLRITTSFADGEASSEVTLGENTTQNAAKVSSDTVVLPNMFLGSYAALARRLVGQQAGATLHGFIAPQGEVPIRVDGMFEERIETPRAVIAASRYALVVAGAPPSGEVAVSVWIDERGSLLRVSVPAQGLEVAREDIASAAARTTSFSVPGDEPVRVPAAGFSLAGTLAKPAGAKGPLPAVILVPSSTVNDRDGFVAGVPVLGQIAADLVKAGFVVVRYDKRGIGQSGGRPETATIDDYSEDVRAIINWLEDERDDVDDERIGLVGHGDGAWVAMRVAARDRRVSAVALIGGASTPGSELILEQQRQLLDRLKTPEAEKQAKIELQQRINEAAAKGSGWDDIPAHLRSAADTPWFQSFLAFDPARIMRDIRQPVLIVHGELDTQVPPHHADRLLELARARRREVAEDLVKVPGVNHLLLPASGNGAESAAPAQHVAEAATGAIASWMAKNL